MQLRLTLLETGDDVLLQVEGEPHTRSGPPQDELQPYAVTRSEGSVSHRTDIPANRRTCAIFTLVAISTAKTLKRRCIALKPVSYMRVDIFKYAPREFVFCTLTLFYTQLRGITNCYPPILSDIHVFGLGNYIDGA